VSAGRGSEALAAGLVAEILAASGKKADAVAEIAKGGGRFEALLLAGRSLEPEAAAAWATAAVERVRGRLAVGGETAVSPVLGQAERLAVELRLSPWAGRSDWLESGLQQRLASFAERLVGWLDHPGPARLADLTAAAQMVAAHGLAPRRRVAERTVPMLLRLVRYLEVRRGHGPIGSFPEAVAAYQGEGAFADLARTAITDAEVPSGMAAARDRLLARVGEEREAENRRFADLLAKWIEAGSPTGTLIPVEEVLERVVAPLAAAGPVLLLVLDGLSAAIFRELAPDVARRGWEELLPAGSRSGSPASVCCRRSPRSAGPASSAASGGQATRRPRRRAWRRTRVAPGRPGDPAARPLPQVGPDKRRSRGPSGPCAGGDREPETSSGWSGPECRRRPNSPRAGSFCRAGRSKPFARWATS